jgi:hypothetical protein
MKKSLLSVVFSFSSFVLLLAGCSTPTATVNTYPETPHASSMSSNTDVPINSAIDFLSKRNELPYYSIDGGESIVADELDREILRQVSIIEKAAYLYGLAEANGRPEDFLSKEMETLQAIDAELPENFGNTASIAKQLEIAHLKDAVQLARSYSQQSLKLFPDKEDFVVHEN